MDGGTRKRRLEREEEEGGEDSEERKMERFFALIRSTKEVRDRISKGGESYNKRLEEGKFKNVWNPAFQPGDFIHDHQDSGVRSTHPPGPSNDRDVHVQDKGSDPIAEAPPPPAPSADEEANEEEDKLDLNLSL